MGVNLHYIQFTVIHTIDALVFQERYCNEAESYFRETLSLPDLSEFNFKTTREDNRNFIRYYLIMLKHSKLILGSANWGMGYGVGKKNSQLTMRTIKDITSKSS